MDIKLFTKMLKDKHFTDYKNHSINMVRNLMLFLQTLEALYCKALPLLDFDGNNVLFIENHAAVDQSTVKLLVQFQEGYYGVIAAEDIA